MTDQKKATELPIKKPFEIMVEGWVKLYRFTFKGGSTIDYWNGDQSCDPNEENKAGYNLNCNHSFYRLNNKKWIGQEKFPRNFNIILNKNFKMENPTSSGEFFFLSNLALQPAN